MRKRAGRKSRLEDRVMRSIRGRSGVVVLRSELTKLGSRSQLTKVLAKLVTAEKLVRVGHGVYVKTRRNKFTGTMLPAAPLETVAAEAFTKLGIVVSPGTLAEEYNSGRTTQIPMMPVVRTGGRRISRRIQMGSKRVAYERASGKGAVVKSFKRRTDMQGGDTSHVYNYAFVWRGMSMQTDITVYADDCTGDSLLVACEGTSIESGGSTWQRALDALAFPSPRGPYLVSNRFTIFIHETLPKLSADTNVLATYRIDVECERNVAHAHIQSSRSRVDSKDVGVRIGDDVVEIARAILRSAT